MAGSALREIFARFGVEFDKSGALDKGDKAVSGLTDTLLGVGKAIGAAFAIDALVGFTREIIDSADEVREAGIALGLLPQHLQELEFAAGTAGVGVEDLRGSLAKFNKVAAESAKGEGKGASDTFKKLGVSIRNADGSAKTSGELFEQVGVAIGQIEDPIERAGVASEFFGRSYAKLLPLFAEGEEGIAKLKGEARELGVVFDDAFLENADEFNDNLAKLKGGIRGIAIQAIAPLLPHLVSWTQSGVRVVKQLVAWTRQTKVLQAASVALGTKGIFALLRAVPALVARFLSMSNAGKALLKRVGVMRAAFITLGRFVMRTVLPFLLLEDALTFLTGGDSVIGRALDKMFGPGSAKMVQDWAKDLIEAVGFMLGVIGDGFVLLWEEVTGGFPLITELWNRLWTDALITFAKAKLAIMRGWNSLADSIGVPSLKIDVSEAEAEIKRLRKQAANIGFNGPAPPGFAEGVRNDFAPEGTGKRALPPKGSKGYVPALVADAFGMRPGEAKARADARAAFGPQAAPAPGGFASGFGAPLDPAVMRPTAVSVPTPPAPITNNDIKANTTVTQHFMVPPGTDVEQQRNIAKSAYGGAREAFDAKAVRAALVPTPGR
jgi:hypothetical protein